MQQMQQMPMQCLETSFMLTTEVVLEKAKVVSMAAITMNELTQGDPQIAKSLPWKKGSAARPAWAEGKGGGGGMARSNEGSEVLVLL